MTAFTLGLMSYFFSFACAWHGSTTNHMNTSWLAFTLDWTLDLWNTKRVVS
jgi:hypothetical protein